MSLGQNILYCYICCPGNFSLQYKQFYPSIIQIQRSPYIISNNFHHLHQENQSIITKQLKIQIVSFFQINKLKEINCYRYLDWSFFYLIHVFQMNASFRLSCTCSSTVREYSGVFVYQLSTLTLNWKEI